MCSVIFEMLSQAIVIRALVVGTLVSLCASVLGLSLVLKRYSMIGDGLSHVGFGTMALATVLNTQSIMISLPIVVLSAFLLLRLSENSQIKGDAAIALISTSSLAIGVMIVSFSTGMNTDVCNYLFGSLFSITKNDLRITVFITSLILISFILFYNKIFALTFDENFVRATGSNVSLYNSILAMLTAFIIVLGMKMMGSLLITSLIIFPCLTAMRIHKTFKSVTIASAIISVLSLWGGIYISYEYSAPGGASVVIFNIFIFIIYSLLSVIKNRKK